MGRGRCAAPPPSVYPTLADGSLVARAQLRFPAIPGVDVPVAPSGPLRLEFGPSFAGDGIATIEPPRVGAPFPVLLPQVDADGNEIAGLRSPELAVPLATYTGWQLYKPELGRDDELVELARLVRRRSRSTPPNASAPAIRAARSSSATGIASAISRSSSKWRSC